jgi:pyruvate dehydrogenase (quinone)
VPCGAVRIDRPENIGPAWEKPFTAERPILVEARTDPNVPPLPPHISFEHAVNYMKVFTKGDDDAWATLRASLRDMVEGVLSKRK